MTPTPTSCEAKHRPALVAALTLFFAVSAASGCGGAGDAPPLFPVSGTVTFDGQPVPDGQILFMPADETGRPDAASIASGTYTLEATAGKKRIEITAFRDDFSRQVPDDFDPTKTLPYREMYIPAKYNTQSELEADVTSGGPNQFDFALTPD